MSTHIICFCGEMSRIMSVLSVENCSTSGTWTYYNVFYIQVLPGLLNVKWEDICKGTKISEILQIKKSEGVTEFENGLCELNWTAVMEEIVAYNPNMQIYQDEVSKFIVQFQIM